MHSATDPEMPAAGAPDPRREALWRKRLAVQKRRDETREEHKRTLAGRIWGDSMFRIAEPLLWATGMLWLGRRYASRPLLHRLTSHLSNLPPAFEGFRILHLSDMHFRAGEEHMGDVFHALVKDVDADLCALTGDFRYEHGGPFAHVVEGMRRMLDGMEFPHGTLAVFGNHDRSEFVPAFEELGIRTLFNEHIRLQRGGDAVYVAGVDDPHHYECDDTALAMEGIPRDAFRLLLAHSPECVEQAAELGVDLYLCGHTHWGQVRIPFLGAPILNSRGPSEFCTGEWEHDGMKGYVSSGLGVTDLPIRFHCRASAALITLTR